MAQRLFRYTALDTQGAPRAGTLQAADETTARSELARQGYLVETIVENVAIHAPSTASSGQVSFRTADIASLQRFFAQLASMQKSAVPLSQALSTLYGSTTSAGLKEAIAEMRDGAQIGKPISETMERYPRMFGPLPLALVRAGETAGILERSLTQVADYLLKEIRLRNKVRTVTFYPKLVLFMLVALPLLGNLIVGIAAGITGGPRIPIPNIILIPWFQVIVFVCVLLWLGYLTFGSSERFRRAWDRALLSVPYIGWTVMMLAMAKFARAFGALYQAGVPMPTTVSLAAQACGNTHLASQIAPASEWVQQGQGMTESLRRTGALTPVTIDMIETGEATGNVEPAMENVADAYENEAEVRAEVTARVLQVVALLIVAVFVVYILVLFYMGYVPAMMQHAES